MKSARSSRVFSRRPAGPSRRTFTSVGVVLVAGAALGALASGCGSDDSTTGQRLSHATTIAAGDELAAGFVNARGWSIRLQQARVAVGALYYFDGAPLTAQRSPRLFDAVSRWFIREAHAHPGHYQQGNALGEMTASTSVDLVAGPVDLGTSSAVTGSYRSASFDFGARPSGPLADEMGAFVVVVEGTAEKDGMVRMFRARATAADVDDGHGEPVVAGCVFEEKDVQQNGTVTVRVLPSVWLDQVDFEEVPESLDGHPVELDGRGTPHRAFTRGLKKGTGYEFSYVAMEEG
ncbi:hypothetical protein [Chondromyces crocatus]|uniref:Uncharacterized protein n=1 Tax=Chondromyces crocatus TaxID=52 RepID=A0A0K1EAD9_CHOCO|nr:hypothetical protein [Chondromyces crocatus]AKT37543.1 uncharacterized protein CMC5_016840 [Chondromyces crocatus]